MSSTNFAAFLHFYRPAANDDDGVDDSNDEDNNNDDGDDDGNDDDEDNNGDGDANHTDDDDVFAIKCSKDREIWVRKLELMVDHLNVDKKDLASNPSMRHSSLLLVLLMQTGK